MAERLLEALSIILLFAMVASFFFWTQALGRKLKGQPFLPLVERPRASWDHVEVLMTIGLLILTSSLAGRLLKLTGQIPADTVSLSDLPAPQQATFMLTNSVVQMMVAGGLLLWIAIRSPSVRQDLGLTTPLSRLISIGFVGALMIIPPVMIVQAIVTRIVEYNHDLLDMIAAEPSIYFFVVAALTGIIVAPFAEEVFFRLLLQGWLESAFSRKKAETHLNPLEPLEPSSSVDVGLASSAHNSEILSALPQRPQFAQNVRDQFSEDNPPPVPTGRLSSVIPPWWPIGISASLFAAAHIGQGPAPISLFFFSLGLGYLYRQTHSVIPCITVHFILNAMTLTLVILSNFIKPA